MNLYALHTSPSILDRYDEALETPRIRWEMIVGTAYDQGQEVYVNKVLKPLAHLWVRDPFTAVEYAIQADMKRWPAAEPIISTDGKASVLYARSVLGRLWPPGEHAIFSEIEATFNYHYAFGAMQEVKIPEEYLKKLMPRIVATPEFSYKYAVQFLEGRFPEGEKAINASPYYRAAYRQFMYRKGYEETTTNGEWDFIPRADYLAAK